MSEIKDHPDSFMNDGPLFNKLLMPVGNFTYEEVAMQNLTPQEKKILNDFLYLSEKSSQLFKQLRHIPQHGYLNWQLHFSRTFDCFSKLWKFQQEHRKLLDEKYGLQRWQIGEIASKIGQLYYHFYLRTSDTNYLHESLIFYLAIRQRDYYSGYQDEKILVKKLRYYARFLVVSIMVNKMDFVLELRAELASLIEQLPESHTTQDINEWKGVLNEVLTFRTALCHLSVTRLDTTSIVLSHRIAPENLVLPDITLSPNPLKLEHALIVGTTIGQPKVTELSIDMFRMGTVLEKRNKSISNISNPIKQYLYKPTPTEIMASLAEIGNAARKQSIQLIYLSGNNVRYTDRAGGMEAYTSDGGIHFAHKSTTDVKFTSRYSPDLLHAEDITPFLRFPTLLIVEGEGRSFFNSTSPVFRQPVAVLLSPKLLPHTMKDDRTGSLMTLFLHSPLMAVCAMCNTDQISENQWRRGLTIVNSLLAESLTIIRCSKSIHPHFIQLLDDPFARIILLRFFLFVAVLQLHTAFKTEEYYPETVPALKFTEICSKPSIRRGISDLASLLESTVLFSTV